MIEIKNLSAGYEQGNVLFDVNMEIPDGRVTVIVGPNGCGKSTLLKTLMGMNERSCGEILMDGEDIRIFSPRELAQKIAYLSQNKQIPELTAERLVLHGRFPYLSYPRRYRKEDLEIVYQAMERMGVRDLAEHPMNTLSGGTRQKIYIAMALAQDTPVIAMDEPTAFLDISYQLQMMEQAVKLAESGKTVIMVLHDLSLAMQTADYLVVMKDGQVVHQGSPEDVYASGCMNKVFGIEVNRIRTPDGWQYYYKNEKEGK